MTSYQIIFKAFEAAKLNYLIVGGVAVNLHGYPRFTNDIDVLLALDEENVKKMANIMKEFGYEKRLPIAFEELSDEKMLTKLMAEKGLIAYSFIHNEQPQFSVDILMAESQNFELFYKHHILASAWDMQLPVVSLDDLVLMKQNSQREKDVQDVVALLELKGL